MGKGVKIMINNEDFDLDERFDNVCCLLVSVEKNSALKAIDTLIFRKGFEDEVLVNKNEIICYIEKYLSRSDKEYKLLKKLIDKSEFRSLYYADNYIPRLNRKRKFIGATKNVIYKTFAGLMLVG